MNPIFAMRARLKDVGLAAIAVLMLQSGPANAESIIVSDYGVAASAMPYAVALEKGYFQEFKAEVDSILNLEGDASVRALTREKLPYAEVSALAAATAVRAGAGIKVISANVQTVVDFAWLALPSSNISSMADLKGKRIGFSTLGATNEALNTMLLRAASIQAQDVTLIRTGGVAAGLTYLQLRGIDVTPVPEPIRSSAEGKYKIIATADILPPVPNAVGITTVEAAGTKGDFIRGILQGRRKAIEYIHTNTVESAAIIARVYKADPAVMERALRTLLDSEQRSGVPYWGTDKITTDALTKLISGGQGSINRGSTEWAKAIDDSFLPVATSVAK